MIITLYDVAGIFPMQVTVPTCVDGEWNITNIELYADDACTNLIADDISFERDLSPSQQMTIIAALNEWSFNREQDKHRERLLLRWPDVIDMEQEKNADYIRDAS